MEHQSVEEQFDRITAIVEKGFAAVADDIANVKTEMRSHLVALAVDIREIKTELRDINRRLDVLEEVVAGTKGHAKEIDGLRDRVRDIERQLGMNKKVAA